MLSDEKSHNLLDEDEQKDNNNIKKRLIDFYNHYNNDATTNKTFNFKCPNDISSISHITNALSRNIQTTITNNIKLNYFKYVKEYI